MIQGGILVNQIPGVPVSEVAALAQEAERLGYSRCWVADQGLDTRDVFVTLTAIAQRTSRLRLGPGITNPYTRHPAVAAAGIATLDELSGGRAFHGLGAGGLDTLHSMGLDYHKPAIAAREMIETTRALFRGEAVSYQGQVTRLSGARVAYARPGLEIWLAGRGPKMLRLGGELADGVMLGFIHKATLPDSLDQIAAGAAASGNSPRLCFYALLITDERMLAAVRPHMYYLLADSPPSVRELLGIAPAELDAIHAVLVRDGLVAAGKLIKEEWIRPFALMGSVAECVKELRELMRRYRIDEFVLPMLEWTSAPALMRQVAEVADLTPNDSPSSP